MIHSIHPLIVTIGILFVVVNTAALLIWLERRLLALWQDRYGPNRVGPFGLLQVLADMIKILRKKIGCRRLPINRCLSWRRQ